jgi:hypothetical protein
MKGKSKKREDGIYRMFYSCDSKEQAEKLRFDCMEGKLNSFDVIAVDFSEKGKETLVSVFCKNGFLPSGLGYVDSFAEDYGMKRIFKNN